MLATTLRGLLAHKLRLALAAMAIVLGVSFVSGTIVLGDTLNKTFDNIFQTTTSGVDVSVRGVSTGATSNAFDHPPVPASMLATVRGADGVGEAFGNVTRSGVTLVDRNGHAVTTGGAPALGVLWNPYADMASLRIRSGRPPSGAGEIAIDVTSASNHGFGAGDTISIVLPQSGPRTFTIAGIVGFGDRDNLAGATVVAFDQNAGPALLGSPQELSSIDVRAAAGVSPGDLQGRIARALPDGVEAVTGQALAQEQSDQVKKNLGVLTTILLAFAFVAVFVGSFIILNTFAILVAQRQRELGLLRALGASRGQMLRSVVLEALITGVAASAVGVAAGALIAEGLRALLGAVGVDLGNTPLEIGPKVAVVGIFVGTIVTLAASLIPARRAMRVSPIEALRDSTPSPSALSARRVSSGLLLVGVGVGCLMVGLFVVRANQLALTGLGALLTFIGVSVLAPVTVPMAIAVLGRPVALAARVPGRLALENARRNPRRTAATASALMVGVGLVTTFTVVAASVKTSFSGLIDRTVTADYIVSPDSGSGGAGLSLALADRVAALPQAATVSAISAGRFSHDGQSHQVVAVAPATIGAVAQLPVTSGVPVSSLSDGDVAVSEDVASSQSLRVGDSLTMQFSRPGLHTQRVAAVFARNALFGDYVIARSLGQSANLQTHDFIVLVKGRPGVALSDLRRAVTSAVAGFPGVNVQDSAAYERSQGAQLDSLLNIMNVLVAFAIVIALLGVVNTMALSIVERTRELGLIRALGMTRSQTRRMVRWETVLITLFGTALGLGVGVFFGWALARAFAASAGLEGLSFAPAQLALYAVLAFVAGLGAAVFPARRASRVNVLRAIASE